MYTIPEHLKRYDWYPPHLAWCGYDVDAEAKRADLSRADLRGADLSGADLRGADLREATYSVLCILQAGWRGDISDSLCVAMMAFDRDSHPNPEAFQEWANGGGCPLYTANIYRALLFDERRDIYDHTLPSPAPWALWVMIAKEFEIEI